MTGTSTTADALRLLGPPLGAWPQRVVAGPHRAPTDACPTGEQWHYQYNDKKNFCSTLLTFDDAGKLCLQTNLPAVPFGSKCTTNP